MLPVHSTSPAYESGGISQDTSLSVLLVCLELTISWHEVKSSSLERFKGLKKRFKDYALPTSMGRKKYRALRVRVSQAALVRSSLITRSALSTHSVLKSAIQKLKIGKQTRKVAPQKLVKRAIHLVGKKCQALCAYLTVVHTVLTRSSRSAERAYPRHGLLKVRGLRKLTFRA